MTKITAAFWASGTKTNSARPPYLRCLATVITLATRLAFFVDNSQSGSNNGLSVSSGVSRNSMEARHERVKVDSYVNSAAVPEEMGGF